MSNTVYVSPILPWDPLPGESNRLRILMAFMLLLALLIRIIVPLVHIPEIKRSEAEAVPERLAKMVVQQKVVPPPPPKPVAEAKPDETLAKTEAKPAEVEKAPKAVATDLQKSAAKARASKAIQDAGINDALAGLRDMDVTAMAAPKGLPGQTGSGTGGKLITSTEEAGTSRNLLTSRAGAGSGAGAAYAGGVSSGFGGGKAGGKGSAGMMGAGVAGGNGKLQSVASGIQSASNVNARVGKDGKSHRTSEDIRKTFDQFGGRLNNLYQRALRDDPTMQGTVRLKLTVAPDGSVTSCSVGTSQLNNADLEAKIVAIVKGFNFGADNVEIWSGTHDLNFFPN
ncbi:MAG: AgmX/PglI C-terminal domain-containing protein [bacterium]|nr:AgmX/PglI C-terminal domain-containing protein [bacterium]